MIRFVEELNLCFLVEDGLCNTDSNGESNTAVIPCPRVSHDLRHSHLEQTHLMQTCRALPGRENQHTVKLCKSMLKTWVGLANEQSM